MLHDIKFKARIQIKNTIIMKKFCLLLIIVLSTTYLAKSQDWFFAEQLGSSGDVTPTDLRVGSDGAVYIVGNYINTLTIGGLPPLPYSDAGGKEDIYLCKFDPRGNALWARQIASSNRELVGGLAIDLSNNVYVVGGFQGDTLRFQGESTELINTDLGSGKYDAFAAKYNSSGTLLAADRVFFGTNVQRILDATYDKTKNLVVVIGNFLGELSYDSSGVQTLPAISPKGLMLARIDPNLGFIDKLVLNGSIQQSAFKNVNNCVIADTVNSYYITGDLKGNLLDAASNVLLSAADVSFMDIMVVKVDDKLGYQWGRKGGGTDFDHINSSGSDGFGNIYFTGKAQSPSIVIDSTGTLQSVPRTSLGGQDYLIAKYNRSGNLQWFNREGGLGTDNAYGLSVKKRRLLYTGNIDSAGNISSGFAIYDLDGNVIARDKITGDGEESGLNVAFDNSGDSIFVIGTFKGDSLKAGHLRLDNTTPGVTDGFFVKYGYKFHIYPVEVTNILCHGESTGYIEVETEFGTPPITYTWTPNVSSTNIATNLPAGSYKIVATGAGGRKDSITIPLTQPVDHLASALVSATPTSCNVLANSGNKNDGALDISTSGGRSPYTYLWSPGGQTDEDITNVAAGDHIVTITDNNSCIEVDTFNVPEPSKVSHGGSVVDTIHPPAADGAVNLNTYGGTPDYSFSWTGPVGFIPSTEDTIAHLGKAGNYNLQVTDANTCVFDTVFNVPADTGISVSILEGDYRHVSCKDDEDGYAKVSVTFGGSGSYSYAWRTSGGTPVGINDDELTNVPAGTYIVKVTDLVSGSTDETSKTIEEPLEFLNYGVDSIWSTSCYGKEDGAIFISVNGGWENYTYLWTPTSKVTQDVYDLDAKTYSVQISAKGLNTGTCVKQIADIVVGEPTQVKVTIKDYQDISCNGGSDGMLLAEARGGTSPYFFVWDDPGAQNDSIATDLAAGHYTCDILDANDCPASDDFVLGEPTEVVIISIDTVAAVGIGSCNGSITVHASGGTKPYQYRLINGDLQTDSVITNLCAGVDTVVVVDANDCGPVLGIFTITEKPSFSDDIMGLINVMLYPNPTTGQFTIELNNEKGEDLVLEVMNMTGQMVYKKIHKYNGNPRFIETIDMSGQSKGVYLLRVNGLPVKNKLMIQ
jgi:hypothetical protein